jgi:hypothetical protein
MNIQWCLKGVPYDAAAFNDATVQAVLGGEAITSAWLRNYSGFISLDTFPDLSQPVLSAQALDNHVHAYPATSRRTPYISLTAGVVERVARGVTVRHSAMRTALAFATGNATHDGYIFLCWVQVSPKPAPELPGFAEEVRDLNIYAPYSIFHEEGEIAAKLFVPARQICSATRFDADLVFAQRFDNPDFVPPDRISNILGLV